MRLRVVQIADGSAARILAPPQLLADAAPHIFREVFDIILRLAERNVEHELALRRVLKPSRGEFQGGERARVEVVDQAPAIHRIPRQAVGVPSQNRLRLAPFDRFEHFIENGPPRLFRRL